MDQEVLETPSQNNMFRSIAVTLSNFIAQYLPPLGSLISFSSAPANGYQNFEFKGSQRFRSEPNLAPPRTTKQDEAQDQRPNQIAERYEKVWPPVPVQEAIFDYSDLL